MVWCLMSMVLGAFIFGAGIVFERLISSDGYISDDEAVNDEFNERLYRQWENLFDYDGTEQEDVDYDE